MISRLKNLRAIAYSLFAAGIAQGCLASQADIDQAALELDEQAEVASTEQALVRGGSNQQRLGYSCTGGVCECNKSIENDCEDMTAACTSKTVDDVITCINGWLTTHCTCTKDTAFVRPKTYPTLQQNVAASFNDAVILR